MKYEMKYGKDNYREYWKKGFFDSYKLKWRFQYFMSNYLGINFRKLEDQRDYWTDRGQVYMHEMINDGYLKHEVFFQDLLIDELKKLEWNSFFEAGCGFGWNIKRVFEEFPGKFVGGTDFSITQLVNARSFAGNIPPHMVLGDNCKLPLKDNAYDVGFSLGVYMNINREKIDDAIKELIRVSGKYIVQIEWDENNTTRELRGKRTFKSHIISHDYRELYEKHGQKVIAFHTHKDFQSRYEKHLESMGDIKVDRWEGFDGPEKYIIIVVETQK